jgi:membrane fusion protein, multidrug efflux system
MKYQWILGFGILLSACSDKTPQQGFEPPPVPIQATVVEVKDVPLYFEAIGIVQAARTAEVKPQVAEMIREIHFTEGDWVEEGALLYVLDETAQKIRMQEAEAQRDQNLAHYNNAKKKLERYRSLQTPDLISKVEWDELETNVALYEAMLKADEARLLAAQIDWEHCRITAPISGFAGKSLLQPGNRVQAETLVTITQTDPLSIDFFITQQELQQLPSKSLPLRVYALGDEKCLGKGNVTFMDHAMDPVTGMLAVSGQLAGEHHSLWPGQSVRVHLYFGKKQQASLIPMRAVRTNQEGPYIFAVKEDQTVEIRQVKLGPEEQGLVAIEEGLEGAGKIVTEGQLRLFPGAKVEEIR